MFYNRNRLIEKRGEKMGNRPRLFQMIGINRTQQKEMDERNYLEATKDLYLQIYGNELLANKVMEPLKNLQLCDVIITLEHDDTSVFGMLPATKIRQSKLYAHELIYTMFEAKMLEQKTQVIKLDYLDISSLVEKDEMEIAEATDYEIVEKHEAEEIQHYKGNWARKYENHSVHFFDRDLEFAYLLFKKMGIDVERKDINRYLVLDFI